MALDTVRTDAPFRVHNSALLPHGAVVSGTGLSPEGLGVTGKSGEAVRRPSRRGSV